jgi:hypothetical protein
MKKRLYLGLFVIIFFLISIGIYSLQIPRLNISYKGEKIQVLKCPFSWDTLLSSKRWDYPAPNELAQDLADTIVEPDAKLDYKFNRKPDNFHITVWDENTESYVSETDVLEVPKDKGTYVFSVIGKWKQGQVLYVFKVMVK